MIANADSGVRIGVKYVGPNESTDLAVAVCEHTAQHLGIVLAK